MINHPWKQLLDLLKAPCCNAGLELSGDDLACQDCGRIYRVQNGIPVLMNQD